LEREQEQKREHLIDDIDLMKLAIQHIGAILSRTELLVEYMKASNHNDIIYALIDLRSQLDKAVNFIKRYGGGSNEQS